MTRRTEAAVEAEQPLDAETPEAAPSAESPEEPAPEPEAPEIDPNHIYRPSEMRRLLEKGAR